MPAASTSSPPSVRRSPARVALELALFLIVLSVPALGIWAASSLAAYGNGSREAAITLGALVFPVLPVAWELWATRRRRRAKKSGPRILTLGDRMTLRTLALSLAFLVPMVVLWPAPLFQALTTRGDWFLDGVEGEWAAPVRSGVLRTADGLVWIYDATHDNPWREDGGEPVESGGGTVPVPSSDERTVVAETPSGAEPSGMAGDRNDGMVPVDGGGGSDGSGTDEGEPDTTADVAVASETAETGADRNAEPDATPGAWPWPDVPHPLATDVPAEAEASIDALGEFYRGAIQDPTERAKAIHDWIAEHVAYDAVSYVSGRIPPQTAAATFRTHLSVCAGYARLFEALGDAAGLNVETVVGDARTGDGEPEGHAWNAIELDGAWALVDTTWDAGSVSGTTFTHRYSAGHFLPPPEVMGVTHFPDDPRWQLRDGPLSRGEWNRQPILGPEFFAAGLRLLAPDRAQIETGAAAYARVESDGGTFLLASARDETGERSECRVTGDRTFEIGCPLPHAGTWTVTLFTGPVRYGTYWSVGSFEALYR